MTATPAKPAKPARSLWRWRHLIARRFAQLGVLLLMAGTVRWGWRLLDAPLLRGDLSASELVGRIPLADPFAVLQILVTGHTLEASVLIGAVVVLAFYTLVGGRSFCAWVCPINPLTDLSAWAQRRWHIKTPVRFKRRVRYWGLGLVLVLSAITGVAAFDWLSPIGVAHRAAVFGLGAGWLVLLAVLLFDLLVIRHGWCGHLCPVGGFYALVGHLAMVRMGFDEKTCTHCGECLSVCPEPQVLDFDEAARRGFVVSGECTNCVRCVPACPEGSLWVGLRSFKQRPTPQPILGEQNR